jgi:DNA ligase-1
MKFKNPDGPPAQGKPSSKAKVKKRKKGDDDDEEEEEDEGEGQVGGKEVPELLLANKWDLENGSDPTDWWISEKLDGVRCVSILGNP